MSVPDVAPEVQVLSRANAAKFAEKWKGTTEEQQHSQAFWQDFFRHVIGVSDLQEAGIEFEKKVTSSKKGTTTRIDVFWKDTFLVEQKSAGKDLDSAEEQARDYVVSLPPALRPPVVIVCDFARIRIVDVLLNKSHEFKLEELPDNLHRIEAVVNHKTNVATQVQVEADQKAAQLMADLYLQLEKYGYEGHEASVFMVRILFCLFADDTRMWKTNIFYDLVNDTNPSGADLGPRLSNLFVILDTPKEQRRGPQDPLMEDFPYVNGGIFSERLETINFNSDMRKALINASNYDWSSINPTIFGALFQDIKSKDERRANGEHYTTEANIDKTIKPLFLDELHEKLETAWDNSSKLKELQRELGTYQILDPACGCGNFLITTYKRLRQLELDIIIRVKQLDGTAGQTSLFDVAEDIHVKMEQLHGIEYVEWSAQIAQVAIYLTDHQENMKLETVLGVATNRFPLSHSAKIVRGNALEIDWQVICPIGQDTVIVGNPPFLGQFLQNAAQKQDMKNIWQGHKKTGVMDYVSNWFIVAGRHIAKADCRAAFVATNSITQGEQVGPLWNELWKLGIEIDFAHRPFAWTNDSKGAAGVHVVIIGISRKLPSKKNVKKLWHYKSPTASPELRIVSCINPYLVEGPEIAIETRSKPISKFLPSMLWGSKPTDDGLLSKISELEASKIRENDPIAAKYLRRLIGAAELINGDVRYCLWLEEAQPHELTQSRELSRRIGMVREYREKSPASITRKNANIPHLFVQRAQPVTSYIAVPSVSSENRRYIPMDYFPPEVIANNRLFTIADAGLDVFAVLMSKPFNIWSATVSGRLESRYSLSAEITYNNFPLPHISEVDKQELELLARNILSERANYPNSSLADLYSANGIPPELLKSHLANDKKVLQIFGLRHDADDEVILAELFKRYLDMSQNSRHKT